MSTQTNSTTTKWLWLKTSYCFCGVSIWLQGIASEAKISGKQNSQLHSFITTSWPAYCIRNPHYIGLYYIWYILYQSCRKRVSAIPKTAHLKRKITILAYKSMSWWLLTCQVAPRQIARNMLPHFRRTSRPPWQVALQHLILNIWQVTLFPLFWINCISLPSY